MKSNCHSPRLEKGLKKQQRPVQPKKGKKKKKKITFALSPTYENLEYRSTILPQKDEYS